MNTAVLVENSPNTQNEKTSPALRELVALLTRSGKLPYSFIIHGEDGATMQVGASEPAFEVTIKNKAGFEACMSMHELVIAEAFMRGDIDLAGDLIKAIINFQDLFDDRNIFLKTWRVAKPLILGREKCNPAWIAKHYDADNLQLLGIENDYDTYTPGIYHSDDESMEVAAERKLAFAYDSLQLKPQDKLLDVGSGWGGVLRFAAAREVNVTGITLSRKQFDYVQSLIETRNFTNAQVKYQDFFTYSPPEKFDAISMMGVIEDLSDYQRVMAKLPTLLKPGGRVYLDFASEKESFATRSFITKYVWPGTFRMVYMPGFIKAVNDSRFEIEGIYNDRHNYHLWAKKGYEKLLLNKEPFIAKSNEQLWRLFLVLYAGTSAAMIKPDYFCSAYRVVLKLPHNHQAIEAA
ncbi:MAG: class I SAM-dependent methyltransferase [Anaerolineaceae bacterium]|nr:class I SAM-dependent methyltransferase [Anaerolineaceae bacterium]MCB9101800.1 class I SAM-dependent methyltransferase [Anaerolineales bacterium]